MSLFILLETGCNNNYLGILPRDKLIRCLYLSTGSTQPYCFPPVFREKRYDWLILIPPPHSDWLSSRDLLKHWLMLVYKLHGGGGFRNTVRRKTSVNLSMYKSAVFCVQGIRRGDGMILHSFLTAHRPTLGDRNGIFSTRGFLHLNSLLRVSQIRWMA